MGESNCEIMFKQKMARYIIILCGIIGLYLPTSLLGNISNKLVYLNMFFIFSSICLLTLLLNKVNLTRLLLFFISNSVVLFYTLFTSQSEKALGMYVYFFLLTWVFCLDLRGITLGKIKPIFLIINIIQILGAYSIIFGLKMANIFINFYTYFYPDLVVNMLSEGKPVLTFGTHSVASFYIFIFFYMNFKFFTVEKNWLYYSFSLVYIYFLYSMYSNTGYVFIFLAVLLNIMYFRVYTKKIFITLGITVASLFLIQSSFLWLNLGQIFNSNIEGAVKNSVVNKGNSKFDEVVSSDTNGLKGRYSSNGVFYEGLLYSSQNPHKGFGYGLTPYLDYAVDSGIVEFLLRGTIVLPIILLLSLFLFFRNNLINIRTSYELFIVFLLFEFAFSNLTYFRTIFLLPFIVVFFNSFESKIMVINDIEVE